MALTVATLRRQQHAGEGRERRSGGDITHVHGAICLGGNEHRAARCRLGLRELFVIDANAISLYFVNFFHAHGILVRVPYG